MTMPPSQSARLRSVATSHPQLPNSRQHLIRTKIFINQYPPAHPLSNFLSIRTHQHSPALTNGTHPHQQVDILAEAQPCTHTQPMHNAHGTQNATHLSTPWTSRAGSPVMMLAHAMYSMPAQKAMNSSRKGTSRHWRRRRGPGAASGLSLATCVTSLPRPAQQPVAMRAMATARAQALIRLQQEHRRCWALPAEGKATFRMTSDAQW